MHTLFDTVYSQTDLVCFSITCSSLSQIIFRIEGKVESKDADILSVVAKQPKKYSIPKCLQSLSCTV